MKMSACEVVYLSRDVLLNGGGHCGTTNPDQNQDRQNQSGGQDPARQPRVPTGTKNNKKHVQQDQQTATNLQRLESRSTCVQP